MSYDGTECLFGSPGCWSVLYLGDEGRPKLTAPDPALLTPVLGDTEVVHAASVEQNP